MNSINNQSFSRESKVLDTSFSLSGQLVEICKVKEQCYDPQAQVSKKREYTTIHPPLIDGMTATSCKEIKECRCCNGLFHIQNSFQCPRCKYHAYIPHQEELIVEGEPIRLCLVCINQLKTSIFVKAFKKLVYDLET